MSKQTTLRPDAKGRVGLGSIAKVLEARFTGRPVSGYIAEITEDGAILLRPQVEVEAAVAATLILDDADRDAFLSALDNPPRPSDRLREAAERHRQQVDEA